jgi:hypothetical protein
MLIEIYDKGTYIPWATIRLVDGIVVLSDRIKDNYDYLSVPGADGNEYSPSDGRKYLDAVVRYYGRSLYGMCLSIEPEYDTWYNDDTKVKTTTLKSLKKRVLKGGHGSGNFGHSGRTGMIGGSGPGGGRSLQMLNAAKSGGFTFDYYGVKPVVTGFSVGEYPERSGVFDVKTVKKADIDSWLHKNHDLLTGPNVKVGGWLEDETNKVWLDVVHIYPQDAKGRNDAIHAGRAANQKCIADLDAIARGDFEHAFIDCGGSGEAPKKGMEKNLNTHFSLFDHDVTADKIMEWITK